MSQGATPGTAGGCAFHDTTGLRLPLIPMRSLHKILPLLLLLMLSLPLPAKQLVLTGARLWDGTGSEPMDDATVVIEDGRITAVGKSDASNFTKQPDADVVELKGKYVIPGLISDHSHLGLVKGGKVSPDNYTRETVENQVRQYEGYGVTAVLSLGLNKDALYTWRDQQRQGDFPGADIFSADRGLGVMKAAPPVPLGEDQLTRPQSADEARQYVREMASRRPDMVKLWVDDFFGTVEPKMAPEIYRAIY